MTFAEAEVRILIHMGRKEDSPNESPEEKRIACREEFERAIKEKSLSLLPAKIGEYLNCGADSQSVLSLIKEGFDCVSESCYPITAGKSTSRADWHFSCSISETIEVVVGLFLHTNNIYDKETNRETHGAAWKLALYTIYPYLDNLLNIRDAGELILDDASDFKRIEGVLKSVRGLNLIYYSGRDDFRENCFNFERNFRESARKVLASEKEEALENKNLGRIWHIAYRYLGLGEDYDRDCAWMAIEEGLKIAQDELFNPEKSSEVLFGSLGFLDLSTNFDFSQKGDFTLFEKAKKLFESAMTVCSVDLNKEDKKRLISSRNSLYSQSRISENKRIVKGIREVIARLDEFTSGGQKKEIGVSSPAKITLLARLTGRLTRNMGNNEIAEKPRPLGVGSDLQFTDGSSAKVLQVFNGGERTVYKIKNKVGRIYAMRVYRGENREKDLGTERGEFVNVLRSQVAKQAGECIPEVYDYKVSRDGLIYVAQEFIEGENLEKVSKPMPEEEIKNITYSLMLTLAEIHKETVAHLDIKPGNLIMTEDGRVAVIDWDLAKKFGENYPQKGKDKKASVAYVSPEVASGIGKVDGKADIYSFGVSLYEFFTGETQTVGAIGLPLFNGSFEQRFSKINEVPEKWRRIIENCTKIDPKKRWTVEEILKDIADCALF